MVKATNFAPLHRKSFYGKAIQIECNGVKYLKSYSTVVCAITPDGDFVRLWHEWSATTQTHVDAFLHHNGMAWVYEAGTTNHIPLTGKKNWLAQPVNTDFEVPSEVKNFSMKYKVNPMY